MLIIDKIIHLSLLKQNIFILIAGEKPCEIIIEDALKPTIGNVYYGIVREKANAEKAVFVEYEKEKFGYLRCLKTIPANGSKILVLIKKTGAGKIPELTTDISISGNFIIYKPFENQLIAVSRKLEETIRDYLKISFANKVSNDEGIIIRSSSQNTDIKNVFKEFTALKNMSNQTLKQTNTALTCVYKKENLFEELIASNASNLSKIITTDVSIFNKIKHFCNQNLPNLIDKIEFCKNSRNIFSEYEIEESFENLFSSKIKIVPNGELSINQTPALTAIDVDSKSAKNDDFFLNSWIYETVLQIKLRNLSGKIVIDPPFLPNLKKLKKIASIFSSLLKNDPVNSYVAGITPLGNIEISRERIRPTTLEILCKSDIIYGNNFKEKLFDDFIKKLNMV